MNEFKKERNIKKPRNNNELKTYFGCVEDTRIIFQK